MFPWRDITAVEAQYAQAWGSGQRQDRKGYKKDISAKPAVASSDSRRALFELLKCEKASSL